MKTRKFDYVGSHTATHTKKKCKNMEQHCNNTATTGKQMRTRKFDYIGSNVEAVTNIAKVCVNMCVCVRACACVEAVTNIAKVRLFLFSLSPLFLLSPPPCLPPRWSKRIEML